MKQEVASFLNYVAASPTVFQATQQACDMLEAAGFTRLSEQAAWNIVPGGRYFVTRNRSAVVAFAVPENGLTHCQIVASHGDSPTFKLKAHAEGEAADAYIRLNVERYGGMIMSTWFDKPLSIAGRALVRENGRLTTKLVDLERDAALIPNDPLQPRHQQRLQLQPAGGYAAALRRQRRERRFGRRNRCQGGRAGSGRRGLRPGPLQPDACQRLGRARRILLLPAH